LAGFYALKNPLKNLKIMFKFTDILKDHAALELGVTPNGSF